MANPRKIRLCCLNAVEWVWETTFCFMYLFYSDHFFIRHV